MDNLVVDILSEFAAYRPGVAAGEVTVGQRLGRKWVSGRADRTIGERWLRAGAEERGRLVRQAAATFVEVSRPVVRASRKDTLRAYYYSVARFKPRDRREQMREYYRLVVKPRRAARAAASSSAPGRQR